MWNFLLLDFSYSFYQYIHTPLGGDLAQIVVVKPNQGDYQVLQNPLGITDENYTNPNRFFAHWITSSYFKTIPLFLQKFVSPIQSVYLAAAIAKLIIQVLLIYLLSVFITGHYKLTNSTNVYAAAIISSLFQTYGFNRYMGIIDQSIVYAIFYALPMVFLLFFYLPLFQNTIHKKLAISKFKLILMLLLIPILSLSGPLLPGIVLIVCLLFMLHLLFSFKNFEAVSLSKTTDLVKANAIPILLFLIAGVFSIYSLYVGQKNVLNPIDSIPLLERYAKLPTGLFNLITRKLGLPILILMLAVNYWIVKRNGNADFREKTVNLYKWVLLFSLLYLLLLPLGGYRVYRPNILRYDTFLPITIGLVFLFARTIFYLIKLGNKKFRKGYVPIIVLVLFIYSNADRLKTEHFECEKEAISELANAKYKPYELNSNCTVMEWQLLNDPQKSRMNAALFHYWKITQSEVLYYQAGDKEK